MRGMVHLVLTALCGLGIWGGIIFAAFHSPRFAVACVIGSAIAGAVLLMTGKDD